MQGRQRLQARTFGQTGEIRLGKCILATIRGGELGKEEYAGESCKEETPDRGRGLERE